MLAELVPFSPFVSTSLLLCGVTSLFLTSLFTTAAPTNAGAGLLRRLPSFQRLSGSMHQPEGQAVAVSPDFSPSTPRPLDEGAVEGGMKRSSSLVRLESAAVGELPPSVLSAMSRASNRL